MNKLKVVIIGSGIVGASIARVLSMYENLEVTIVEKEVDVGWGASKANTGIIHPGHEEDPRTHPLRAKLCARGNNLWRTWTSELEIPVYWPGELMVYTGDEEERRARDYIKLAKLNGVPGVRLVDDMELRTLEPLLSQEVRGAIYAPTAGVISPFDAVIAVVENAVDNGVKLLTETEVVDVKVVNGSVAGVETSRGLIEADVVVNAAGIYADKISHIAGVEKDFHITPRKGEYVLYDEEVSIKPLRVLHTTPTPKTKGVYAVTTVHGNLMLGPTAEDLPPDARDDVSTSSRGIEHVMREASRILKELPPRSRIIRTFAGLRAEPSSGDWLIRAYEDPWGFINVAGMRSPGLTAAPAIAEYVAKVLSKELEVKLEVKKHWNPYRKDITRVRGKTLDELDLLIAKNPCYGEVICCCKMVTKAEVLEAIKRMRGIGIKTITLDGLKFRTHSGFGKCQGSFCRWRVALIVSQQLNLPYHEVVVKKDRYGVGDVKVLLRQKITLGGE
ncbi:MAG: NAD(P)/FAD-dependent oxidoreductase [Candidatus Nezhaarchaeota archaeon]|nr:NAD(P)/FAD-dependent oxidoreductase [Candidatus Nezhaarchaeota archaeon]MCX8141331.1 NAD(P)/FAD-dependent oxidoreductase [Candidatus Nezhaarchaeota archaeon]MDW8049597.1 NAD(P)/FAD-dependent oxidoreductase [Nitrososphaerota archaeon]